MTNKVAVVIPAYKNELNPLEKISLAQCRKILGHYPLILIVPAGKNFSYFMQGDIIVHFPPQFFQSLDTYNQLMMSPFFYAAFKDFEYILIYQPDAFVFRDELEYFCSLGYDYIGAPWPQMYRKHWRKIISCVGNGGFSLRNVKAHYDLLVKHSDSIKQWQEKSCPEDVFFSYCGKRDDCNFNVAPINVAYKFSAEYNFARVVKKNGGKLPFGCHAWHTHCSDLYFKIFRQCGFDLLPFQKMLSYSDVSVNFWLKNFAIQRLARRINRGQSILRYLPTKRFSSVRVIREPFTMMILMRLLLEDNSLADKIFLYEPDEQDILLHDLIPQKQPHLLITSGGIEITLISSAEKKGLAYGKRVVSFQSEYIKRCEELFRKLGK